MAGSGFSLQALFGKVKLGGVGVHSLQYKYQDLAVQMCSQKHSEGITKVGPHLSDCPGIGCPYRRAQ